MSRNREKWAHLIQKNGARNLGQCHWNIHRHKPVKAIKCPSGSFVAQQSTHNEQLPGQHPKRVAEFSYSRGAPCLLAELEESSRIQPIHFATVNHLQYRWSHGKQWNLLGISLPMAVINGQLKQLEYQLSPWSTQLYSNQLHDSNKSF